MKSSIRFKIKNHSAEYNALFLTLSYGYKDINGKFEQLKLSTGITIPSTVFSPDTGVKSSCGNIELKRMISKFKEQLEDKLYKIGLEQPLTEIAPEKLKYLLSDKPDNDRPKTLVQFINQYVEEQEAKNKKLFAPATIQSFKALSERLSKSGFEWRLKEINEKYIAAYLDSISPKYKLNSMWKERKMLRKFCRLAKLELNWSDENLVMAEEETTAIYLSFEQIRKLMDYDFGDKMYLDRVRDGLLFQCFTGMRFSDFKQKCVFESDKENEYIVLRQTQKTKTAICIPVLPPLKQVLIKYNYVLPNDISNVNYNFYLKEIGAAVFKDEPDVMCYHTINGKMIETLRTFGELLVSHTGRRSMASNFYELGIPVKFLMSILGMKKESTFLKYIRQTKQKQAKEVLKHVMNSGVFQSYFSEPVHKTEVPLLHIA